MKKLYKLSIIFTILSLSFWGCKKDSDTTPPFLGYNYFPLKVGSELIYQVDSIGYLGYTYNATAHTVDIDTASFQIKEVVESFFTDNEGRTTARIERYKRMTPADPWIMYRVFSANTTATAAERFEDNFRFFKLVFPPAENEKWNGLARDSNNTGEYYYESVNVNDAIGPFTFDSTLTVIQNEDINLITYTIYIEKYAAGVGLYFKEYYDYEYENITSSMIKDGFIYKETLISYTP